MLLGIVTLVKKFPEITGESLMWTVVLGGTIGILGRIYNDAED